MLEIDVSEQDLATSSPKVLDLLLIDRTTDKNVIWATDHYMHLGPQYGPQNEITVPAITGVNSGTIQPRAARTKEQRWDRTKEKAEVSTPSWLCNEQNNLVDQSWFGRPHVFNTATHRTWIERQDPIRFEQHGRRTWQRYVDERRLEMACGEAPYLVSRYDTTTGEPIDLSRRIGLLDRKMRVVTENACDQSQWLTWARRAYESVYGFELQGDNLLLARENHLATYIDYARSALPGVPRQRDLVAIANIISWNIWQMDALTYMNPLRSQDEIEQLHTFGEPDSKVRPCVIRDWRGKRTHKFRTLVASARRSA